MKIEVDQSGKIEFTEKTTVIADSLGNIVCLSQRSKRAIQKLFRKEHKPQIFITCTFAAMVALLISQRHSKTDVFVIDVEYPGKENEIKAFVVMYLNKLGKKWSPDKITFNYVGKKSKSHEFAYKTYKNLQGQTKNMVKLVEIFNIIH